MKKQLKSYLSLVGACLIGITISFVLYFQSVKQERERTFSRFNTASEVFVNTLDLTISNQIIRLQNFEENIEEDVARGRGSRFINTALKNSVFSAFSIFRLCGTDSENQLKFQRTARIEIPNTNLPAYAYSDTRLQSKASQMAAANLLKTGTKFYPYLAVRDDVAVFAVAWHSSNRPKNFYFITGAAMGLFEKSLRFDPGTKILMRQKLDGATFVLELDKAGQIAIKEIPADLYENYILNAVSSKKLEGHFSQNYFDMLAITLDGYESYDWPIMVLITGFVVTLLLSLLIFSLVNRNVAINQVVEERTADLVIESNKAKEAAYVKTRFLANVSHEIRSPLNIILGMSDLLKETGPTTRQSQYIENLQTAGNHLLNLINDILEMARVDSNDVPFKPSDFSMIEFLEQVARLINPSLEKKELRLYLEFDPQLPSLVESDPGRLRQVLINLLNNAVKFTDSGFIKLAARVIPSSHPLDSQVEIEFCITDSGCGIPESAQADIFKAFYQVNPSLTRLKGGVGLGLSIVQAIVARFNGRIDLVSKDNSGSTFSVKMPMATSDARPWTKNYRVEKPNARHLLLCNDLHINETLKQLFQSFDLKLDIVDSENIEADAVVKMSQNYDFIIVGKLSCKQTLEASGFLQSSKIVVLREPLLPRELIKSLGLRSLIKDEIVEAPEDLSPTNPNTPELSLLIVDDDPSNRILMQAYLKDQRWQIRYAKSGEEALDLCNEAYPDILVTDLQMPSMDGFTLISNVRQMTKEKHIGKNPKFVVLTADALPETAEYAKSTNIDFYLTKPIRKKDLLETIHRLS